jgi:acetamidase/formamidase
VIHRLSLERRNLHGHFSRDLAPVLEIAPGDSVRFSIPNSGWLIESGEKFTPRDPAIDTGHALVGPIAVRGAKAGQTLAVRIDEVRPGSWGITKTKPPHFIRWTIEGDTATSIGRTVRIAPFLGVLGMPPAAPGVHSTIPPRRSGGNIDCKDLVAGTTLYLPVSVDGALFSAGDGHAAQGDGEVSGTAIETPVEAQVTLSVRDDLSLEWPIARAASSWFAFGFDEDLDKAARIALDGMLDLMVREHDLTRDDALALASVVVDLRVTQIANKTLGVHAVLRDDAFA